MSNATFRIESVSIEGFKAFTTQQTFRFEGRNIFLFGANGSGKTSIVEAIRWCLFGLGSRQGQDEIVKNQFYGGPCVVRMALRAPDGLWTMQRRLRASGGESDRTIRDPNGSERNLEDVLPQLSRIGPQEGAHVIYAAQQPSSRRPEANITDFSYVVYRYLGVEEVPRLSDALLTLSKDWGTQEEEMCDAVDELGEAFSQSIADVDERLAQITSNPPWGNALTPSNSDTREKIDLLAESAEVLGASCSRDSLDGLTLHSKLYQIETAVHTFLSGELAGVSQKLTEMSSRSEDARSSLESVQSSSGQLAEQSDTAKILEGKLEKVLNGSHIEELENELEHVERDFETAQLKSNVIRASLKYLETVSNEANHETCPACDAGFQSGNLKSQLQDLEANGDIRTDVILEKRDQLKQRISTANQIAKQIETLKTQIDGHKQNLTETLEYAYKTFGLSSSPSIESLQAYVAEIDRGYQDLQSVSQSQTEALNAWQVRIDNFRREVQFHELRLRKERLHLLYNSRYQDLHDSLRDLVGLRDIADNTRSLLNAGLHERLQKDLPPVAQEMTDVYLRLTGTPTFNSISIRQGENTDGSMSLDLRVSSTRGPGTWGVRQGILNGQALNAIQLVPYFVFSRYQDSPLLDLLLLDDPTQAFDTQKIQLLLTELSSAASHATLFVATHEEERFLPVLKNFFGPDNVQAYRALGIDEDGPRFENVSIDL